MLLENFQSVVISYIPVLHMKTVLERLLFICNMANYSNLQTQRGIENTKLNIRALSTSSADFKRTSFSTCFRRSRGQKKKNKTALSFVVLNFRLRKILVDLSN